MRRRRYEGGIESKERVVFLWVAHIEKVREGDTGSC
jgi:hypothetical protein